MATQKNLATAVGSAVGGTMTSVEDIHKRIAAIPIDLMETALLMEEPLKEARKLQDDVIGSIYELARGINDEITRAASKLLERGSAQGPKVAAKAKNAA